MIRQFVIEGFKRFREETVVALDPITVLVGLNGSGKSTILQALAMFQYCLDATLRTNANGLHTERKAKAATVYPQDFGALPITEPADLWPDGRLVPGKEPAPIRLGAEFSNGASVRCTFRLHFNRFRIRTETEGNWQEALNGRELRLVPLLSTLLPREEYLTPPARQERIRMQRHAEMIRNLLWDLRENAGDRFSVLIELLGKLFPESRLDIRFDIEVDRFLTAGYQDDTLRRSRDVTVAGSGFHQALQILTAVLAPGVGTLLLDEPDAHLHARLQGRLMRILVRLAAEEETQFVMATHAPQILDAAPEGAIRVCAGGRVDGFTPTSASLSLLQDLGALDQMEIVPLLTYRCVVFVENRTDRRLLEAFAVKHWGESRRERVWRRLSFLYMYGSAAEPAVLSSARQVHDLLTSAGIAPGPTPRMLAISDRDWRTDRDRRQTLRDLDRKAGEAPMAIRFLMWKRREIENYLLDQVAALATLDEQARVAGLRDQWEEKRGAFIGEWRRLVAVEREQVRRRVASRIQQQDRRLDLGAAMRQADAFLESELDSLEHWCDAKRVLSALRGWLQANGLPFRLRDRELIGALSEVPKEMQAALYGLEELAGAPEAARRPLPGP